MEVPNYDQAVLFAERAASLGPLPDSLLRLLCSGAPAAMLLASNCLHHLCASTQTDVRQRVTLGSLRGVVTLLAALLGGMESEQSRVTALELLEVVLLSRKGSCRQTPPHLF
ncbi:MAG: hypothetical protein WDW36_001561 [Sanguina aurantia]